MHGEKDEELEAHIKAIGECLKKSEKKEQGKQ